MALWESLSSERCIRFLYSVFLFCIPFQARLVLFRWTSPFNEWTAGFLWATDILFLILLGLNVKQLKVKRADWLLGVFLVVAVLSIFHAFIPAVAWYRLIKLVEYILIFWLFRSYDVKLLGTAKVLVASGVFQSILAIIQYIHQADLGLRFLGESPLDAYGRGVAVLVANGQNYLRAYGTFPHPNLLAVWLMLCLWACAWWYWRKQDVRILGAFVLMLLAFYLTFSRVAIGAWSLVSLCLVIRYWPGLRKLAGVGVALSILFAVFFWPQVETRLQIHAEDEAVAQRIFYAKISTASTEQHLLLGIGIGQFVPMLMKTLPHYPADIYQPSHNLYLLIANEIGIFGILVFVMFIFKSFYKKNLNLVIMFSAFLLLGMFDHYFWTLQQGSIIWWGLLGFIANDRIEI